MNNRLTMIKFLSRCDSEFYPFPRKAIIVCLVLMVFTGIIIAQTITVQSKEKQQMRYGLDFERLWFWYGPQTYLNQCAQWSVVDCDVDYLRVAINSGYELVEGTYNLSAYTNKIIPMMTTMKAANPDIKFFASPRPLNEAIDNAKWQPYPIWITGAPDAYTSSFNFDWQKCAEYLVRYLELMDSYGFKITYLDVTNEWQSYPTGGRLQPSDVPNIRNYLISNLPANIEMPLIIAPSAWSFSQGKSFVNYAVSLGESDGFDIAASHNTGYQGTAQDFADAATAAGKEAWDSEVHGWKGSVTADEISTSNQMFDRIRAGFSGLNGWLAIGQTNQKHCYFLNYGSGVTRNVKYYIFKKLTTTSNYGYALDVNLPDEFTSTAALIRGDLLTIWVLNNSSDEISDVQFVVNDQIISDTPIQRTRWNDLLDITGYSNTITKLSDNQFQARIKANTLHCFEVRLAVSDLDGARQAHYAFDGNTDDSSDFLRHGIVGGDEVYATGIIDQAMVFDGMDDYVEITGYKGITGTASRTCTAWINTSTANGSILIWGDTSVNGQRWDLRLQDFGGYPGRLMVSVKGAYRASRRNLADGNWHHVAAVLEEDGTPSTADIKLYIDGVEDTDVDTVDYPINTAWLQDVTIGSSVSYFNGLIDDVRIYAGVLDEYQIADLYFTGRPDGEICILEENDLQYDYTADCQVDLSDAAVLSSLWLGSADITDLAGLASEWLMTDFYSAPTPPPIPDTFFETFDSDPTASGWINAQTGNTTFTYNATGYVDAEIYRDSTNTARFYKSLEQNYNETDEFWFEYDAQIVSASSSLQRAFAGLFNASVSDNNHDLIGARFSYWEYSGSSRGNRHDLYCYATDGTDIASVGDPISPGIAYDQNIRVKMHYWYESDSDEGKASLDIHEINTDGSTGSLIMVAPTTTVLTSGKSLTLNVMGLGNRTDGTSSDNNVVKIDNMYFSTEAENPSPTSPSF